MGTLLVACSPSQQSNTGLSDASANNPVESGNPVESDNPLQQSNRPVKAEASAALTVLARIQQKEITQTDIDEAIQLELYDLEWAKYELRRAELAKRVKDALESGHVKAAQVHVLIEPPLPPRLEVPQTGHPGYGPEQAPVTVSVFCSYQSSHCARMQSVYAELMTAYPNQLRFVFFDYPQAFHKHSQGAAYAARCAEEQGVFWPFHKALWTDPSNLNQGFYLRTAKQLGVDEARFKACIEQEDYMPQVKQDYDLAKSYGFGNVPVTLVNGWYLRGPKTLDTLRYFVDKALLEQGQQGHENMSDQDDMNNKEGSEPAAPMQLTRLPLRLEGLLESGEQAKALITDLETSQSANYREYDEIRAGVYLVLIEADRVVLENNGTLEYLPLSASEGVVAENGAEAGSDAETGTRSMADLYASQRSSQMGTADQRGELPVDMPPAEELDYTPRPVVAAQGETPLSRQWIQDQLLRQSELEGHFQPAAHEVEGVHVLKLQDVSDNEFYQTLGLREGDVVLRVNDEWVHEAQNNLFAHLENAQSVSVVLMRKGLPVHLNYAIN